MDKLGRGGQRTYRHLPPGFHVCKAPYILSR